MLVTGVEAVGYVRWVIVECMLETLSSHWKICKLDYLR